MNTIFILIDSVYYEMQKIIVNGKESILINKNPKSYFYCAFSIEKCLKRLRDDALAPKAIQGLRLIQASVSNNYFEAIMYDHYSNKNSSHTFNTVKEYDLKSLLTLE